MAAERPRGGRRSPALMPPEAPAPACPAGRRGAPRRVVAEPHGGPGGQARPRRQQANRHLRADRAHGAHLVGQHAPLTLRGAPALTPTRRTHPRRHAAGRPCPRRRAEWCARCCPPTIGPRRGLDTA
jgi:hypothetical protein